MQVNDIVISIFVITYNSSKTVVETLESIKLQTYKCIELIISDDCSNDNTVAVCKDWIKQNCNRFYRTQIIETIHNTGIAANSNRAIKACTGEWIKGIAGDDILLPCCIELNYSYVLENPDINILFSKMGSFTSNDKENYIEEMTSEKVKAFFSSSAKVQNELLSLENYCGAPTAFAKTNIMQDNLYDEIYAGMEDYPQWFGLTKKGIRLCFMDKLTVLYRCDESITRPPKNTFYSPRFMDARKLFFLKERRSLMSKIDPIKYKEEMKEFLYYDFCMICLGNKQNILTKITRRLFVTFVNIVY